MIKKSISMENIRPVLTDIVDRARLNGEETIITKNRKPCAKVVGLTQEEKDAFRADSSAQPL